MCASHQVFDSVHCFVRCFVCVTRGIFVAKSAQHRCAHCSLSKDEENQSKPVLLFLCVHYRASVCTCVCVCIIFYMCVCWMKEDRPGQNDFTEALTCMRRSALQQNKKSFKSRMLILPTFYKITHTFIHLNVQSKHRCFECQIVFP